MFLDFFFKDYHYGPSDSLLLKSFFKNQRYRQRLRYKDAHERINLK